MDVPKCILVKPAGALKTDSEAWWSGYISTHRTTHATGHPACGSHQVRDCHLLVLPLAPTLSPRDDKAGLAARLATCILPHAVYHNIGTYLHTTRPQYIKIGREELCPKCTQPTQMLEYLWNFHTPKLPSSTDIGMPICIFYYFMLFILTYPTAISCHLILI